MIEKTGNQGPIRRTLLMSQAEAQNKTKMLHQPAKSTGGSGARRDAWGNSRAKNVSLSLINKPDATWGAAVQCP